MKNLSVVARVYILGMILAGLALTGWVALRLNWANPWLYLVAAVGAVAQMLKLEGPNARTNYSVAWFVYGFALIAFGPVAAMFVVLISHLAEWAWHKYPWYIQSFNIGNHLVALGLGGLLLNMIDAGAHLIDVRGAVALVAANLVFVLGNHFLVGVVVRLARGQSFAESGVLGFLTLFLDFCVLSMGAITALVWRSNPLVSILNILPLYLLYNSLRVPALQRQVQEMGHNRAAVEAAPGD